MQRKDFLEQTLYRKKHIEKELKTNMARVQNKLKTIYFEDHQQELSKKSSDTDNKSNKVQNQLMRRLSVQMNTKFAGSLGQTLLQLKNKHKDQKPIDRLIDEMSPEIEQLFVNQRDRNGMGAKNLADMLTNGTRDDFKQLVTQYAGPSSKGMQIEEVLLAMQAYEDQKQEMDEEGDSRNPPEAGKPNFKQMNSFEKKIEKVFFELDKERREQKEKIPREIHASEWKKLKKGIFDEPMSSLHDTFELEEDVKRMREKPR
jgi:hypothetical protein